MDFRQEWIISEVAPTIEDLNNGRGCHLDEAITLINYLEETISAQSAAKAITSAVLHEADPPGELYRVWRLLGHACEILDDQLEKLMNLLAAIQRLGPSDQIDWSHLQGFKNVWNDLYGTLYEINLNSNEKRMFKNQEENFRNFFRTVGTAEAEMFVRNIGGFTELWGYEILNLICSGRFGLEVYISHVHAWLEIAGPKLAATFQPGQVKCFTRAVRGRPDKKYEMEVTMAEHWEHWKKTLLQVSHDEDFLSAEARQLAAECYDMMKSQAIKMPWTE
ncbi:hypothetical protein FSARC_12115 [Fusarium sarcochroum]|uniref:Uncharacterized protein n=1 Tax=Fusarium sarcochroum TaxID=1208366 RepID=A0A8H4TAR1_9HYPO|nr:hypothetical protein FSARC_12115 [Fusarium sarcochroum]